MKVVLILGAVIVLGVGGWLVFGRSGGDTSSNTETSVSSETSAVEKKEKVEAEQEPPESTEPPEDSPKTHQVSYVGGGFTPESLKINAGDTVVFTNNRSSAMWIASDPHPIHTDLSGFDSQQNIAAGQTYRFTFEKTGTFGYHDHLSHFFTGTIVVE